ncbi:MAG: L,D-transpeptidase family protein [Anaerolineales bacterium]|nr:L,D-transpeptidase family protein [Anaerolineales bacterium]
MSNSLSKLRESMNERLSGDMPQGGSGAGNREPVQHPARSGHVKKKRNLILPILLVLMGCAVFSIAAWSAVSSPALASILNRASAPQPEPRAPGLSFAPVNIAKPTYTAMAQQILPTATSVPPTVTLTQEPAVLLLLPPTDIPTLETFILPNEPETPASESIASSVIVAEIVPDTPTPEYTAPTAAPYVPPQVVSGNGGERWIDVDLSQQRLYAYEGDTLVNSFVVSTGTWQTPTVTGRYKVWIKLRSSSMSGPGYYLPDVPYIMYFYKGYGIHGTYWHNNFGTPMSHGCVNMTISDAEWVYNFSVVGTVVNVHY